MPCLLKKIIPNILELIVASLVAISILSFSDSLVIKSQLILLVPIFFFPIQSLKILFLAIPLFGNKPGTLQYLSLTLICSLILFCTSLRSLKTCKDKDQNSNLITWLGFLYLLIGSLSLVGHLSHPAFNPLSAYFQIDTVKDLFVSIYRILLADELKFYYPITALLNLFFALSIAKNVYRATLTDSSFYRGLAFHLVTGVLLSILCGLLDYFDFFSLLEIRSLDPQVNAGGTQFRLQSFFGHSGWYAEYLTFGIPFIISLMLLPIANSYRIALCLGAMIIGEYALILTYQRGGWISYPLTLIGIWSAIYIFRNREKGARTPFVSLFKITLKKVVISLPITIIISISLVKLFAGESSTEKLQKYATRASEITQTQDRIEYIKAGTALGMIQPILGGGLESFGLQYVDEISNPSGGLYKRYDLPFHGSAHNFYLQIFSGTGLVGLGCLLFMIFAAFRAIKKILQSKKIISADNLCAALITATFLLAILIYGCVQEIFYIQILQILFFATMFAFAAIFKEHLGFNNSYKLYAVLSLSILFVANMIWAQKSGDIARNENRTFGCYPSESDDKGWVFNWCGPTAYILRHKNNGSIKLKVQSILESPPSKMSVFYQSQKIAEFHLDPGIYYEKIVKIPKEYPEDLWVVVKNEAAMVPETVYPKSNDYRLVSFKLTPNN